MGNMYCNYDYIEFAYSIFILRREKIIAALIFNILALVVDYLYKRFIKTGATFKMLFDYKLFGFTDKDRYNGLSLSEIKRTIANIINRYPKSYKNKLRITENQKLRA